METIILRKKGSPYKVIIRTDPADPYFTFVELQKVRDGLIAASHYILSADSEQWRTLYMTDGYKVVEGQE